MMNYDPIDTCPYDPVHRILRSRMQYHLTRCAKNWPCSEKKQCPFDARHIINEIEFNYHVSVCPKRESVWRYKIVESTEVEQPKILPIETKCAAVQEENWDDDAKVKSYDPMKNTEDRAVTRMLIGASKSERKRYRIKERLRLSRLEDATIVNKDSTAEKTNINKQSVPPSKKPTSIPEEASAEIEQEYKPLRRPKKLPLDISRTSDFSTINDSAAINQTQDSVNQIEFSQFVHKKETNKNEDLNLQTTFSYAAAAKNERINFRQQNISIESDYDVVIESEKFDVEKDNNCSFLNNHLDESLVKVTETVKELNICDEEHKAQSQSLDRTLESLKKTGNYSSVLSNGLNKSNNDTVTTEKKSSRCAANFNMSSLRTPAN